MALVNGFYYLFFYCVVHHRSLQISEILHALCYNIQDVHATWQLTRYSEYGIRATYARVSVWERISSVKLVLPDPVI